MTYFLVFAVAMLAGYLFGSVGVRHQRNEDLQRLIDLETVQRKADGLYRKGDDLTETEPVECGVICTREVKR